MLKEGFKALRFLLTLQDINLKTAEFEIIGLLVKYIHLEGKVSHFPGYTKHGFGGGGDWDIVIYIKYINIFGLSPCFWHRETNTLEIS